MFCIECNKVCGESKNYCVQKDVRRRAGESIYDFGGGEIAYCLIDTTVSSFCWALEGNIVDLVLSLKTLLFHKSTK